MHSATQNAANEVRLQVPETDDSCRLEFVETVPLVRDTDGSSTTKCIGGDWSAEVKQENLAVVKQETDDVYYVAYVTLTFAQQ